YPGADIFTLVHAPGTCGPVIESRRITTSFLQRLPAARSRYRHYLPLFPLAIESLDLRGYDLVISTSHAVAKGCRPAPGARHVADIPAAQRGPSGHALIVSALVPYKRVELAVEAFTRLGRKLVVAGDGPELPRLMRIAGPTVRFLGGVAHEDLPRLYAGASF